ncbi:MAG TPA: hypothetical protein VKR06_12945 [Ktedonosporobacter sp.]|nr:hypothetical protein [Ktedonosporobacter sp.]
MLFILVLKGSLPNPWGFYDISYEEDFYLFVCVRKYEDAQEAIQTIKPDLLLFEYPLLDALALYDHLQLSPGLKEVPAIVLVQEEVTPDLTSRLHTRQISVVAQKEQQDALLQTIKQICTDQRLE